jgi:hypothetical protein
MFRDSNPGRVKRFSSTVQTGTGSHLASYSMGTWVLSQRWRQEREVDQSPPPYVDIKSGTIPLLSLMPSWRGQGQLRLFLPFITIRTILRYFEGIRLHVFFTELLIRTIVIWSISQPPYILYYVSFT